MASGPYPAMSQAPQYDLAQQPSPAQIQTGQPGTMYQSWTYPIPHIPMPQPTISNIPTESAPVALQQMPRNGMPAESTPTAPQQVPPMPPSYYPPPHYYPHMWPPMMPNGMPWQHAPPVMPNYPYPATAYNYIPPGMTPPTTSQSAATLPGNNNPTYQAMPMQGHMPVAPSATTLSPPIVETQSENQSSIQSPTNKPATETTQRIDIDPIEELSRTDTVTSDHSKARSTSDRSLQQQKEVEDEAAVTYIMKKLEQLPEAERNQVIMNAFKKLGLEDCMKTIEETFGRSSFGTEDLHPSETSQMDENSSDSWH